MTHADDGMLQSLLDGELSRAERSGVERHLEECPACRAEAERLRAASAALTTALGLLDRPVATEHAFREVSRRRWRRWVGVDAAQVLRRAAVLVVGVAAAASATVPGSPVRGWIRDLWHSEAPASAAPGGTAAGAVPDADPAIPAVEVPSSGVSVLPDLGRVKVVLTSPSPRLRIRVRLSDDAYSDVRATGAAAGARFRTGPGRVEVTGAGAGEVEVAVPREARSAVVEVDGRAYFRKDGEGIRLLAPASDSSGTEVVFTVRP